MFREAVWEPWVAGVP